MDTSGDVLFNVKFKAIIFKPREGEVVDGFVHDINQVSTRLIIPQALDRSERWPAARYDLSSGMSQFPNSVANICGIRIRRSEQLLRRPGAQSHVRPARC